MSKFVAVVITAAICLPLGALLRGEASAERRYNAVSGDVDMFGIIEGHPQLSRAQAALHEALDAIEASMQEGEPLWSDKSGRAAASRDAIQRAVSTLDRTADWVTSGMALHGSGLIRNAKVNVYQATRPLNP